MWWKYLQAFLVGGLAGLADVARNWGADGPENLTGSFWVGLAVAVLTRGVGALVGAMSAPPASPTIGLGLLMALALGCSTTGNAEPPKPPRVRSTATVVTRNMVIQTRVITTWTNPTQTAGALDSLVATVQVGAFPVVRKVYPLPTTRTADTTFTAPPAIGESVTGFTTVTSWRRGLSAAATATFSVTRPDQAPLPVGVPSATATVADY